MTGQTSSMDSNVDGASRDASWGVSPSASATVSILTFWMGVVRIVPDPPCANGDTPGTRILCDRCDWHLPEHNGWVPFPKRTLRRVRRRGFDPGGNVDWIGHKGILGSKPVDPKQRPQRIGSMRSSLDRPWFFDRLKSIFLFAHLSPF